MLELDLLLEGRPPSQEPNLRTLRHHEPSRSSGRNGDTAPARQHPCRRADLPHLDGRGMASRHVSPVRPPEMEAVHLFHYRRPDPQTPHHRSLDIRSVTRELLQRYLEQKAAAGCSFSVVDHLRWDLRAIFRLAAQDRLLPSNPAEMLFTPPTVATPSRRVLTPEQVQQILSVLGLREQLLVRLALVSGMRPGEILALQWKHVVDDHVEVLHPGIHRCRLPST